MKSFPLQIVTPEGVRFIGEAESILIRTTDGDVEILAGHSDLVSAVGTGRVRIKAGGESKFASASGGILTVKGGTVKLICVTLEFKEDIDLERANLAKEKAEERIARAKSDVELDLARAKLQRALSRINVSSIK